MKIITPALRPKAPARKLLLSFFLNSTSAPPIPVAEPAIRVNISALAIPFMSESYALRLTFMAAYTIYMMMAA